MKVKRRRCRGGAGQSLARTTVGVLHVTYHAEREQRPICCAGHRKIAAVPELICRSITGLEFRESNMPSGINLFFQLSEPTVIPERETIFPRRGHSERLIKCQAQLEDVTCAIPGRNAHSRK